MTLDDIEAGLDRRGRRLFPPAVEAAFEEHSRRYRARRARAMVVPTVLAYNLFLVVDYTLLPASFWLALALHLLVVTPLVFVASEVVARSPRPWMRDLAAGSIPTAMVVQILSIYAENHGPTADHYQYLAIMMLVFMNTLYRLEHRRTIAATCIIAALYVGTLMWNGASSAVLMIAFTMTVAASYLTLTAHERMERDARYSFLRRMQDQLRRREAEVEATRDSLTGLFNRRQLDARIAELWKLPDEAVSPVAVIMLDIDHFKAFNDRYGHLAGDLCLKRVAGAITTATRSGSDLVVRFGGEEFLLLLPVADISEAVRVAERLRQAIEALAIPNEVPEATGVVTASVGVMAGPVSAHTAEELISGADRALYAAKRSGRNVVWPPLPGTAQAIRAANGDAAVPLTEPLQIRA